VKLKISRREFLAIASALLLSRPVNGAPARLARKDCFFGLHFDLHPTAEDTSLGRDLTDAMVGHLLESCHPDFIQYDSKGHPGYLGFPSKTGMSAPGIMQDSLAIWRRVTAANGVALYNHFSGVLDGLAVTRHTDWARIGPNGTRDSQETSLFGPYERLLMIEELTEVALNYDLDGSWVDGDCWAVNPDYCEAARNKFLAMTNIDQLPKSPGDPGWNEFLEIQREQFRQYVSLYVDALHRAKPGYQITSNWMYSTFVPERPGVPLDYLSGDVSDKAALRQARIQARYLSRCGKAWDLMSWGFESGDQFASQSGKPSMELEQEAAVILAQGGAYQIYYVPSRAGWIDDRIVKTATEVGRFCRQRQRWSHRSESVPEAGVLYSGRTLYRTAGRVFGPWDKAEAPAAGAVDLLLACGYSVDLIPDWQVAECAAQYPLIVVPDWQDIGEEVAATLTRYMASGGKLLLFGADNALLFSATLGLRLAGKAQERTYFVADGSGFAQITGSWIGTDAAESRIVAHAYRAPDTRPGATAGVGDAALPLAVRLPYGKGTAVVCLGPIASAYGSDSTPILRSLVLGWLEPVHPSIVRLNPENPAIEAVLRKKNGQLLIHLINTEGAPVTGEFRHSGVVPQTGPIRIRIRLSEPPLKVFLEPDGTLLSGEYVSTESTGGEWSGVVPDLHIHTIIRIQGRA
jgi:hypothetical protein